MKFIISQRLLSFMGGNGTGKSIFLEYIVSALRGFPSERIAVGESEIEIELSNPVCPKVICFFQDGLIRYKIGEKIIPFCPFKIEVIYLHDLSTIANKMDHLARLAQYIDCERDEVRRIIEGCDLISGYVVDKAWLKEVRRKPYPQTRILLHKRGSDKSEWDYAKLSGQEGRSVILDLIIGYATELSRYKNALLIVDWNEFQTFDDDIKEYYMQLLQKSGLHFQTIMSSHTMWSKVNLSAWSINKFTDKNVEIKWDRLGNK